MVRYINCNPIGLFIVHAWFMGIQNPQFWTGSPFAYGLCSSSFQTSNATLETRMHFVFCTFYPSKKRSPPMRNIVNPYKPKKGKDKRKKRHRLLGSSLAFALHGKGRISSFFPSSEQTQTLRSRKHSREINKSKYDRPRTVVDRTERKRRRKKERNTKIVAW